MSDSRSAPVKMQLWIWSVLRQRENFKRFRFACLALIKSVNFVFLGDGRTALRAPLTNYQVTVLFVGYL